MADGTAQQCGRVGSCHILLKAFQETERLFYFQDVFSNPLPANPVPAFCPFLILGPAALLAAILHVDSFIRSIHQVSYTHKKTLPKERV
ncbi:MAG: hypothetical protein JWQ27_2056 [Ferruginibacter sp.]|nr:hypothetical protein [Ferruginibacter sp.]